MSNNKTFTLLITGYPPEVFSNCPHFPTFESSLYCLFPGWVLEISQMLAYYIHAEIVPIYPSLEMLNEGYGAKINGTWKGFLEAVETREVDVVSTFYQFTDQRAEDFVFSYPVYNLKLAAFVKGRERTIEDYIWSSFEPFTLSLWFVLFAFVLGQALYGTFIQYIEYKLRVIKKFDKFEHIWLYSRLLLLQGEEIIPFFTQSGHFAFILYALLLVTLFTNLYQGSLLSALLQQSNQMPFQSWDEMIDLVEKNEYSFVAYTDQYDNEWYYTTLMSANNSYSLKFQSSTKNNPVIVKDTAEEAIELMAKGKHIFISQEDENPIIEITSRYCNILKVTEGMPEKTGSYLFHPDNPLIHEINHAIIMNQGFIRKVYQKYFVHGFRFTSTAKCVSLKEYVSEAQRPLDIVSTFGVFLIFVLFIFISVISFAAEICYFRYEARKKQQKKNASQTILIQLNEMHLKTS